MLGIQFTCGNFVSYVFTHKSAQKSYQGVSPSLEKIRLQQATNLFRLFPNPKMNCTPTLKFDQNVDFEIYDISRAATNVTHTVRAKVISTIHYCQLYCRARLTAIILTQNVCFIVCPSNNKNLCKFFPSSEYQTIFWETVFFLHYYHANAQSIE